ncbi:hypothetical protein G9A89_021275 [Geosiphon pyriformis]|nr:hypothetical protein G9A89_021275 [Geosiphon pyriformis]
MTIVQIHYEIEQYANKNYPISTKNTREHVHNPEINHKKNQQKLGTLVQIPKKNIMQSPNFGVEFENCEEESKLESKKTSKKTSTRPVIETSSQSKNQEIHNQEKELNIREAIFRDAQGNIIPPSLRPINPPAGNNDKMATPYIV